MIKEFIMSEKEVQAAENFEQEHLKCEKQCPTTIGGNISYRFTPTSIGTTVSIKCFCCGKEENITDYDLW